MSRLKHLFVKEVTQLRRDRRLLIMLLLSPTLQLLILGFAASTDVREIDLAVRDYDRSFASREYVRTLEASDYFKTTHLVGPEPQDERLLVSGRAGLLLVIPEGFARGLARREQVPVQVIVDGSDSNFAARGLSYLARATGLYSERLVRLSAAGAGSVRLPSVTFEPRAWYNPDLTSRHYMVPGVMGILLLVTTMVVTSMAIVKEREQGTMDQLIVTPLRAGEIVAGKLLPFVGVGFVEVTLTLPIVIFVYHIAPRGSLLTLYALSALFLLSTLGLGLLVSTLVRTQQQAMMVAAFFVMLPFVLLSGFAFPVASMPPVMRAVAAVIPLKYFLTAIRGIFLKGVGWRDLWVETLVLAGWGPAVLSLAIVRFRRRLE
jgi:ABC-2 type transport system permease protein